MNIKIYQDRRLLNEDNNFGSENENLATTLMFEFPEYVEKEGVQFATKDLNKTIIFDIEGDNELPIVNNQFSFPYDITKLGEVVWNIALKEKSETEDMTDKLIWYSETMISRFGKTNEGHNEITTEKLDAFNVVTTILNEKIAEVEALKVEIGDFKQALDNKVDKEEGKGLSTNDFTDILKEKLENLENYNDEEIRNILNSSLKEVNYTASNGTMTFITNDGSKIEVDLPLELLVESGKYDETNKQIVLVLANGNNINIPVSSLLDDFYGKEETYNKTEVDNLIAEKQKQIEALEDEIDELIEENQSQQEEINMLTADYKENTIEGETVAITDGLSNSKASAIGNGNSYQYSTEGYNKLQLTDTEVSKWGIDISVKDNVITAKGTSTGAGVIHVENIDFTYLANQNYTICAEVKGSSSNTATAVLLGDDTAVNKTEVRVATTNVANYMFEEDTTVNKLSFYINLKDVTVDLEIKLMMKEGTYTVDTMTPKEPYTNGASPNTEYKQDIEVVTEVSLVQRGKNLLNDTQYKGQNIVTSFLSDITKNVFIPTNHRFKKDKFYKFNILFTDGTMIDKTDWDVAIAFYNANKTSVSSIPVYGAYDISNYDLDSIRYLRVITNSTGEASYGSKTIQAVTLVELDNSSDVITLEDFEEYKYDLKPIDLQGNSIAKVGEIADLLKIGVDGSVSLTKNTGRDNLENADWGAAEDTYITGRYRFNTNFLVGKIKSNTVMLCNYFKTDINYTNLFVPNYVTNPPSGDISFYKDDTTTYEDWLNWITENELDVLYQLLNPETISLPSIEPITLFEGTNVFELVTNLGTTMSVTYKVSNKSRLEKLENAILSVGGNV